MAPAKDVKRILIINPNSNEGMTSSLKTMIKAHHEDIAQFSFITGPSGAPASINNEEDAELSQEKCIPGLTDEVIEEYDAFVVACYSKHPLVLWLQAHKLVKGSSRFVTGIFEASIEKAMQLMAGQASGSIPIQNGVKFGIISTGKQWEEILSNALMNEHWMPHQKAIVKHFAGVTITGLSAKELHDLPAEVVASKMKDATRRLLRMGSVSAICLGCAGMAGLDEIVRAACIAELGQEQGSAIHIVDGVLAAVESCQRA